MNTELDKNSQEENNSFSASDKPAPVIQVNLGRFAIWGEDRKSWLAGLVGGGAFMVIVYVVGWMASQNVFYYFYAYSEGPNATTLYFIVVHAVIALFGAATLFPIAYFVRARNHALSNGIVSALVLGVIGITALGTWQTAHVYRVEQRFIRSSEDGRRISDIKQIELSLEIYYDTNFSYPKTLVDIPSDIIPTVPKDPDGTAYPYYRCSPSSYHIGASLANADEDGYGGYDRMSYDSDKDAVCEGDPIRGGDSTGCLDEPGRYCYDVVAEFEQYTSQDNLTEETALHLISPNGGENLCTGHHVSIEWEGAENVRTVSLWIRQAGDYGGDKIGVYPGTLNEANIPGKGKVIWPVGVIPEKFLQYYNGYAYEISIVDTDDYTNTDRSDGVFSIQECRG